MAIFCHINFCHTKGGFFSESEIRFFKSLNLPKKSFQITILSLKFEYRKVASSRLSWLVAHSRIFRLFIWSLCNVTFGQRSSKLNSRPVYCSQLYGKLFTVMGGNFKFQVQDRDLEYFFLEIWRFKKQIALSDKKPPLDRKVRRLETVATTLDKRERYLKEP